MKSHIYIWLLLIWLHMSASLHTTPSVHTELIFLFYFCCKFSWLLKRLTMIFGVDACGYVVCMWDNVREFSAVSVKLSVIWCLTCVLFAVKATIPFFTVLLSRFIMHEEQTVKVLHFIFKCIVSYFSAPDVFWANSICRFASPSVILGGFIFIL